MGSLGAAACVFPTPAPLQLHGDSVVFSCETCADVACIKAKKVWSRQELPSKWNKNTPPLIICVPDSPLDIQRRYPAEACVKRPVHESSQIRLLLARHVTTTAQNDGYLEND